MNRLSDITIFRRNKNKLKGFCFEYEGKVLTVEAGDTKLKMCKRCFFNGKDCDNLKIPFDCIIVGRTRVYYGYFREIRSCYEAKMLFDMLRKR